MPSKSKNNKSSSDNKRRADEMRKTIMRNPEVRYEEFPPLPQHSGPSSSSGCPTTSQGRKRTEDQENDQPGSTKYHLPKMNTGYGIRNKLADVAQVQLIEQQMSDLSIGTKKVINKEVSSRLNFKLNHKVFKDLIPLEDKPETPPKRVALVEKSKDIVDPKKKKANALKNDIFSLIDGMMVLDYEHTFIELKNPTPITSQAENDYLGFSKFTSPRYHLTSKEAITRKYCEQVIAESEQLYTDEDYLDGPDWAGLYDPREDRENQCSCLKGFTTYSKCV